MHPQRPGRIGRLLQRRWQIDGQTGERAGDQQIRAAANDVELQAIRRLPCGALGPVRYRANVGRAAQRLGRGRAKRREAQAAIGLGAALQMGLPTMTLRRALDAEARLGEVELAARRAQQRQVGADAQVAAGQLHAAEHGRLLQPGQRQLERQVHLGRPFDRGACQGILSPVGHRRDVDITQ